MPYRLSIHRIDQICLFDLTWGQGQRLTASVAFPASLVSLYDSWQRAYLGYYKQSLRGRAGVVGQVVATTVDWHSQLVQAEARLLSEFHTWLKHGDLFDLRQEILAAARDGGGVELFLTCTPVAIARLPWETWEFGPLVQIVRAPATIRAATANRRLFRKGKARVLAILGDETGLNFDGERTALNGQRSLMEIHYVGWQPGEDPSTLRQRICQTIADPQGWDVLFFAGHSNEAALLSGQIAIAPNTTLAIQELAPYLQQAQQRGLQFALFNSCSGIDIAQGLINLGLGQVAIMREPIHNEVAQTFLVQFLQRLAAHQNAQAALHGACQFLKAEQSLTYPSAYLVPSLFRHPGSKPYQIEPMGWQWRWRRWRPTRREVLGVGTLALMSLIPAHANWVPQAWLMDQRVWVQAVYRDVTHQVPANANPLVVLVQMDGDSFIRWGATDYKPINRAMLADTLNVLTQRQATVVGIDYILDLAQPDYDPDLNRVLEMAIAQRQIWTVFATTRQNGVWLPPHPNVIKADRVLQGNIWVPWWRVLPQRSPITGKAPFSYQLAIAHRLSQSDIPTAPQPSLQGPSVETQVQAYRRTHALNLPSWGYLHPLTRLSYLFQQQWLQPLLDFSIPPEAVFLAVPAWQIWEDATVLPNLEDAVVIVAPGGYHTAGLVSDGEDNMPIPPAIAYWRQQSNQTTAYFTGGEAHAYMVHHLLSDRLVVPIPDLWLILVAALGGKALSLYLMTQPTGSYSLGLFLGAVTLGYGLVSLQLYISAAVMLPWLLPTLTLWFYGFPRFRRHTNATD